jgi:hypothetical protein
MNRIKEILNKIQTGEINEHEFKKKIPILPKPEDYVMKIKVPKELLEKTRG